MKLVIVPKRILSLILNYIDPGSQRQQVGAFIKSIFFLRQRLKTLHSSLILLDKEIKLYNERIQFIKDILSLCKTFPLWEPIDTNSTTTWGSIYFNQALEQRKYRKQLKDATQKEQLILVNIFVRSSYEYKIYREPLPWKFSIYFTNFINAVDETKVCNFDDLLGLQGTNSPLGRRAYNTFIGLRNKLIPNDVD